MEKVILDSDSLSAYHFNWKPSDGKTYSVDFKIYDISWVALNGKTGEKDYPSYNNLEDYDDSSDHVPTENTLPKISGSIKWDGCCNYEYHEKPMFHMCGLGDFKNEFEQLKRVYEECAIIMESDDFALDMMGLK